jgi:predicted Zn-dependent protease with MMP-like domain
MNREEFESAIADAVDSLPEEFLRRLDNVEIMWEDEPQPEMVRRMGGDTLLGLYEGVPLTERNQGYSMIMPDRITLYRRPIERVSRHRGETIRQIRATIIHEIGHYFGLSEAEIREAMGD